MERMVPSTMHKPSIHFRADLSKAILLLRILFVICVFVCLSYFLSVLSAWRLTASKRADLLAVLYVMFLFSCVLLLSPYDVLGQVWYLIVPIPDLCLLSNFKVTLLYNLFKCLQITYIFSAI